MSSMPYANFLIDSNIQTHTLLACYLEIVMNLQMWYLYIPIKISRNLTYY